jgi:aspartate kinase
MFRALADANANILMISTSEIKTAVIVKESEIEKAAQAVHTAFGLDAAPAA